MISDWKFTGINQSVDPIKLKYIWLPIDEMNDTDIAENIFDEF